MFTVPHRCGEVFYHKILILQPMYATRNIIMQKGIRGWCQHKHIMVVIN